MEGGSRSSCRLSAMSWTTKSCRERAQEADGHFGKKTISFFGSTCLMVNNLIGVGIASMPQLWQGAGAVPAELCLAGTCLGTLFTCLALLHAIRCVPGNANYERRMEFSRLLKHYFPRHAFSLEIFVVLSFMVQTLATIVQTAQCMDQLLVSTFGQSCGLELLPSMGWVYGADWTDISVFGDRTVISAGLVLLLLISWPLAELNLDDNINVQVVATLVLTTALGVAVYILTSSGWHASSLPVVGSTFKGLLGTLFFNFGLAVYIPSWVNEKVESVNEIAVLSWSVLISFLVCSAVAVGGAVGSAPYVGSDRTLFNSLVDVGTPTAQSLVYVIPLVSNLSSIPVMLILVRYNLESMDVPKQAAKALTVMLIIVSVFAMRGHGFIDCVNIGGSIFTSMAAFIIPVLIFAAADLREIPVKVERYECSAGKWLLEKPGQREGEEEWVRGAVVPWYVRVRGNAVPWSVLMRLAAIFLWLIASVVVSTIALVDSL